MSLTINGEPVECVGRVEWVPAPIPKMLYVKLDPEVDCLPLEEISKMVSSPEWFELIADEGVILGRIRDVEIMGYHKGCNPVRAQFEPNPAFVELEGGYRRSLNPNTAVFLYDSAGKCKEIYFVREG